MVQSQHGPPPTSAREGARTLRGALPLAAALTLVLVLWFGRACFGGWWLACRLENADAYMLASIYERWADQVASGHLPLWFPEFAGGGQPLHAAWMYGLFYPPLALFLVLPPEAAWTWLAIAHVVFGAVGMHRFLRDAGRDDAAAACGAIVFALSNFVLGRLYFGHLNLVMPFAWTPWTLLWTGRTARGVPRATAWLALCLGVGVLAGHAQIWFYVGPLLVAHAAFEARRAGAGRAAAGRLLLAGAGAAGIAAVQWVPALELLSVAGRPREQQWVLEAGSASTGAIVAGFAPRLSDAFRPGSPSLALEAVGLGGPLAVIAALVAFRPRDRGRVFWFVVLALGLLVATGLHNEVGRLANELPPFRWARAPGRAMALVVIAGAVLASATAADVLARVPRRARAAVPAAFLASALALGVPTFGVVRTDFLDFDWVAALPPESRGHRLFVRGDRYPWVERFGVPTFRPACPVDTPGYRKFATVESPAFAPLFDAGAEIRVPSDRDPPADLEATRALAREALVRTFQPAGRIQWFRAVERAPDEEALLRLAKGERTLFVAPEDDPGGWRSGAPDSGRDARVLPRAAPDRIDVALDRADDGIALVSEKWYPGWEADPPARVVRGDLALLALSVDKACGGTVTIRYRPWWRLPAIALSGTALLVVLAALLRRRAGEHRPAGS